MPTQPLGVITDQMVPTLILMYVQIPMGLDMITTHINRISPLIIQAITVRVDPPVGTPQAITQTVTTT